MSRVHLFIQSFVRRDAVSNHTRHLQVLLGEHGLLGNTYAAESRGAKRKEILGLDDFSPLKFDKGDIAFYQLATGSPIAPVLAEAPVRVGVNYHNITTAESFFDWEPHVAGELDKGRRQMLQLANKSEFAIADSQFNEQELIDIGYHQTTTVPILFDATSFARNANTQLLEKLKTDRANGKSIWLFVGRIAPNKCQHDIVKAFAYYRQVINANAHLYLVGGSSSHAYLTALKQFIGATGMSDSVTLAGGVSDDDLAAYYQGATVFVCLSEHEGFCVPLLEAFHNELPIVAFDATAVPETLGNGGMLLRDKSPAVVATAVEELERNSELRGFITRKGLDRLGDFDINKTRQSFLDALKKVL